MLLILALQDKKDMADGKVTKGSQGFYVTDCPQLRQMYMKLL